MSIKTKKATFNLHTDILSTLDQIVASGAAPSKNALVERALLKEIREMQKQERKSRWQQGTKDKMLLKDIEDVEIAFRSADVETAPRID